jgi:hypothetical protein
MSRSAASTPIKFHWIAVVIVFLAFAFRIWQLPALPPGLWFDESYNAMDAYWMLQTGAPQVFFSGNTGNEPGIHYLAALFFTLLGTSAFSFRFINVVAGTLTVALTYRWLADLGGACKQGRLLALAACGGMAFSFWHVLMSRTGYRALLIPLAVLLICILFWRGIRRRSRPAFIGAGVVMGLAQYIYLSARLLPLVFGLFAVFVTLAVLLGKKPEGVSGPARREMDPLEPVNISSRDLAFLWKGLLLMAVVSAVLFAPLGYYYMLNPAQFSSRTGNVFIFSRLQNTGQMAEHIMDALRIFIDSSGRIWRHTIVGQSGFDIISRLAFWLGLGAALYRWKRPEYSFLLIGQAVMWLPSFISLPAVEPLHFAGMLPFSSAIIAVGLLAAGRWLNKRLAIKQSANFCSVILVAALLLVSSGRTAYNYFVVWAGSPQVYDGYLGHLADLARAIKNESRSKDILLPFNIYNHPSMRFALLEDFQETNTPPPESKERPALLVAVSANDFDNYVWLTRSSSGKGLAVVNCAPRNSTKLVEEAQQAAGQTLILRHPFTGKTIATLTPVSSIKKALPAFYNPPELHPSGINWGHDVELTGYSFWPDPIHPGQRLDLNLCFKSLNNQPLDHDLYAQLIDAEGRPITQEQSLISEEIRWRTDLLSPNVQHLWLGADAKPGPYLVRFGFLDADSNKQTPKYKANGEPDNSETILGLFYVTDTETAPRRPEEAFKASLGSHIQLIGYNRLSEKTDKSRLSMRLFWQAAGGSEPDQTVFVQFLDGQNKLVASMDKQPLNGLYPTSHWYTGEIVTDDFSFPLPEKLPAGTYRLVTGMYDAVSGRRLPATDDSGRPLPDDMIELFRLTIP